MNTRKFSTVPNHKIYRDSIRARRAVTRSSTERAQPKPLGASDSPNTVTPAEPTITVVKANPNPKRYTPLRIRLRGRSDAENTATTTSPGSRYVISTTLTIDIPDSPLSVYSQPSMFPRDRRQVAMRPCDIANSRGKPLPEIMIRFTFDDTPKTAPGIPMNWLVDRRTRTEDVEWRMKGGSDHVLDGTEGDKILLRIIWMPYIADMWYRVPILDDYSRPITRAELARRIARTYQEFMEKHKNDPFPADRQYKCFKIGGPGMKLSDMRLHSITRLSNNEWEARVNHAGF